MIQRIQSLFLLLVAAAMALIARYPIWKYGDTTQSYVLDAWQGGLTNLADGTTTLTIFPYRMLGIFVVLSILLALFELFCYANRAWQLRIGAVNTLIILGVIGLCVYFSTHVPVIAKAEGSYQIGFFGPLVAMMSNLMANHFIRRDEQLVRKSKRLR